MKLAKGPATVTAALSPGDASKYDFLSDKLGLESSWTGLLSPNICT